MTTLGDVGQLHKADVAELVARVKRLCPHLDKALPPKTKASRRLTFLLGAGISKSAGIPLANEILDDVKARAFIDSAKYDTYTTKPNEYAMVMRELEAAERVALFREYIGRAYDTTTGRAKTNWCHLLLATLAKHDGVNQFLTTNFDPLLVEAMALTGQRIRAFDLLASSSFVAGTLQPATILYLHGQATGLFLANTDEETTELAERLPAVLQDAVRESIVIVLGYSGNCDPVLKALDAQFKTFPYRLYWVPYRNASNLCDEARQFLQKKGREAFVIEGYDADEFMRELVIEGLKLDLPDVIMDPVIDAKHRVDSICPYPKLPNDNNAAPVGPDILAVAQRMIQRAVDATRTSGEAAAATTSSIAATVNTPTNPPIGARTPPTDRTQATTGADRGAGGGEIASAVEPPLAMRIVMAAISKDLAELESIARSSNLTAQERQELGRAFLHAGWRINNLDQQVRALQRARSLGVPQSDEPWLLMFAAVVAEARAKSARDDEAERLWGEAMANYAEAVRMKPRMHEAWNNWGTALDSYAQSKQGLQADALRDEAKSKYAEAVRIKPDKCEAFYNWGNVLDDQAKTVDGTRADSLRDEAKAKYAHAVSIRPQMDEAWCNWGNVLGDQAKTKDGGEAETLRNEAMSKFSEAVRIRPDMHEALNNWGNVLCDDAKSKTGTEADASWVEAMNKYAEAVRVKPDKWEAWFNWGNALRANAKGKSGIAAHSLWSEAISKYTETVRIKPDMSDAWFNLASSHALRGDAPNAVAALNSWRSVHPHPTRAKIVSDSDFDGIRSDAEFAGFVQDLPEV